MPTHLPAHPSANGRNSATFPSSIPYRTRPNVVGHARHLELLPIEIEYGVSISSRDLHFLPFTKRRAGADMSDQGTQINQEMIPGSPYTHHPATPLFLQPNTSS